MAKNKVTQAARRALASQVKNEFSMLNNIVKPKPKRIPLWFWQWGASIFLDVELIKEYMTNRVKPADLRKKPSVHTSR